jgi:hypothetical protein
MKTQILESTLAQYGVEIQYYYDRLRCRLDSATNEADLQQLIESKAARPDLEKNNKFRYSMLSRLFHFDVKLELFQLSKNDLTNFLKIEGDCRINYVEFSLDLLCPSEEVFNQIVQFFHKHLVSNSEKPHFHLCENEDEDEHNNVYFNESDDKRVLVYYRDRKMGRMSSKETWCLHIEYRVKGILELKKLGIFTSEDLVNFQHEKLWDGLLNFRFCKFYTEFGRFFYPGKQPVPKTLSKKGKAELQKIRHLQKYLIDNPDHTSAFPEITDEKLQKLLGNLNLPKMS